MRKILICFFLILLAQVPGLAEAQQEDSDYKGMWIGPRMGSVGFGAEVGYRMDENIGVRFNFGSSKATATDTTASGSKDVTVSLSNTNLLVDWYLFSEEFKFSAGVAFNDIEATLDAQGDFRIGDYDCYGCRATGKARWGSYAPYASIGSAWKFFDDSFSISWELGALYIGHPTYVKITAPAPQADIAAEEAKMSDIGGEFLPVGTIGCSIHF